VALSIPQFEEYLTSLGVGAANDSGARQMGDVRLSPGQLAEMQEGGLSEYQGQQIQQQGYLAVPGGDMSALNQQHGTNFQNYEDYFNYIYGPGGSMETGPDGKQYYKTPNGTDKLVNPHLRYTDPDKKMSNLVKMGLFGLAGAGLGGFLPGVEGVFGGMGAGAGGAAGAAEGAAAAGASGAGGTSWLTGGLAPGAGIGGVGTAGLGLTAPTAAGIGSLGSGLGLVAGVGAGATMGTGAGGGILGGLGDFVSSIFKPVAQGGSGLTAADFAKTGLNYLLNQNSADNLSDAAKTAASMSNPLNDPQRQGYQQDLAKLLANPTDFYNTNPVVKAQMDLARRQFEANSAKMGVGGTQFNNYLQNVQNNAATTFNDQAELLAGLAGFNFPSSGSGQVYQQGMNNANTAQNESYRGLWDLGSKVFNSEGVQNFMKGSGGNSNDFSLG